MLSIVAFSAHAQPSLSLGSTDIEVGATASVSLSLSGGTEPYAGFNADILLPDGVSINSVEAGANLPAGFVIDSYMDDASDTASIIVYSDTATLDDGILLELNLYASHNAAIGSHAIPFDTTGVALSNIDGSVSISPSTNPGSLNVQWGDTDNDGLPDDWEFEHFDDPDTYSWNDDPDGDGFSNIREFEGGTDPTDGADVPDNVLAVLDVTPPVALVVGGSAITVDGTQFNASCRLFVNGVECADVVFNGANGTLSAIAPPGDAGSAELYVEDPDTGAIDQYIGQFSYTADPFSDQLDTSPGTVRSWADNDVTVQYGYVPDSGPLNISMPSGTELSVPSALGAGFDATFIIVRSADRMSALYPGTTITLPDEMNVWTSVFDIGGFVYTGDASLHLDGPFMEPVTVILSLLSHSPDEDVYLGLIETDLGEDLTPEFTTAGSPQNVAVGTTPGIIDTDTVAFEIEHFTTYLGLSATPIGPPGDVNIDKIVNAVDIQLVINDALGLSVGWDCDINNDNTVNAVDVQLVINAALGIDISASL